MTEKDELYKLEQILFSGSKTHRQIEIARRQILKYNPSINDDELELLLSKRVIIEEKVKECIREDLDEFIKRINESENETDIDAKCELMEALLFDIKLRIPDVKDMMK